MLKESKIKNKFNIDYSDLSKVAELANQIHNFKYNYIKIFKNKANANFVEAFCSKHNYTFSQKVIYHLSGGGCVKCLHDKLAYSLDEYIPLANKIHDNKYNYIRLERTKHEQTIHIYCPKHNYYFSQLVNNHLHGDRCLKCTQEKTRWQFDEFKVAAEKIHGNKFKYISLDYSERHTKIIYECNLHGKNIQSVGSHLRGKGCRYCRARISKKENKWLEYLQIPNTKEHRNVKLCINNKNYFVDGFEKDKNIIYEFLGDYWHGNPIKYNKDVYNEIAHKTFGELYNITTNRLEIFKNAGYKVVSIWENDWDKLNTKAKKIFSLFSKEDLQEDYKILKKYELIAKKYNISKSSVCLYFKKFNIKNHENK